MGLLKVLLLAVCMSGAFSRIAPTRGRQSVVEMQGGLPRVVRRTAFMPSLPRTPEAPAQSNGTGAARLLWHQHEDTAIYDSVAISTQGYIAAATFLNPPQMVEVYKITGETVSRKAGVVDMNHDGAQYEVALSRDSTICVGMATEQGNFTSLLFKWDLKNTGSAPEWTHAVPQTIARDIAISADGAVIALLYYSDVSYLRPSSCAIELICGHCEKDEILAVHRGKELESPVALGISGDGHYIAYISTGVYKETRYINMTVIEYSPSTKTIKTFTTPLRAFSQHIAVSRDGNYIALSGLANDQLGLDVYKRVEGTVLRYEAYLLKDETDFFLIDMAFSPDSTYLATTWAARTLHQNRLVSLHLPTKTPVIDYLYPVDTGDRLQDEPASVAISGNGEYVVVGSWGTENHTAGSEQIQVFKNGEKEPIYKLFTPGSMFSSDIMDTEKGVFIVSGGKAVPANMFGNGGDIYAVEVTAESKTEDIDRLELNDPELINKVNKANAGWEAGVNPRFEGQTVGDIRGLLGTHLQSLEHLASLPSTGESAGEIPEEFDARKEWPKCIHPIRNQGHCGSCWAFAASEALSDRFCIASKGEVDVILSPEYLVECDKVCMGCGGGWLIPAWDFMEKPGLPTDKCYPYKAFNGSAGHCQPHCSVSTQTFSHYQVKEKSITVFKTVEEMQTSIMTNGPIEAGYTVYLDFMQYKSGVYKHVTGPALGGHAVKIVGWGVDKTTKEKYWIIANSWGPDWGSLNGYFWFLRGVDECLLESNSIAGLPDVKTTQ